MSVHSNSYKPQWWTNYWVTELRVSISRFRVYIRGYLESVQLPVERGQIHVLLTPLFSIAIDHERSKKNLTLTLVLRKIAIARR